MERGQQEVRQQFCPTSHRQNILPKSSLHAKTDSGLAAHQADMPLHATGWKTPSSLQFHDNEVESSPPTDPGELGAHVTGFLHQVGTQHVLGTLGVDVAVSCVQGLCLIHHPHRFIQVTTMLSQHSQVALLITFCRVKETAPPPPPIPDIPFYNESNLILKCDHRSKFAPNQLHSFCHTLNVSINACNCLFVC